MAAEALADDIPQLPGQEQVLFGGRVFDIFRSEKSVDDHRLDLHQVALADKRWKPIEETPSHLNLKAVVTTKGDFYNHAVYLSEPKTESSKITVIACPGLGEQIGNGIGKEFHDELAKLWVGNRVISVANNGVDNFGDRLSISKARELARLDKMAEQRLRLLSGLASGRHVVLVSTSESTVIAIKMMNLALAQTPPGKQLPVKVEEMINYASAVATPDRIKADMKIRFPLVFPIDLARVWLLRTPIGKWPRFFSRMMSSAAGLSAAPALYFQGQDLSKGVPLDYIKNVAREIPLTVIAGDKDPLRQEAMWHALEEQRDETGEKEFPGLRYVSVPGLGHAMTVQPKEAAKKVTKESRNIPRGTKKALELLGI